MIYDVTEVIDKSIEKKIRDEVVSAGFAVQRSAYPANKAGYDTAMVAIKTALGFAIEVFGVSNTTSKGIIQTPRIVITRDGFLPGSLGGQRGPKYDFNASTSKFDKKAVPPEINNIFYTIHIVSSNVAEDRVLHSIIAQSVPSKTYIPFHNDATSNFFIDFVNEHENPIKEQGIIKYTFQYLVADIYMSPDIVIDAAIAPINDINIDTVDQDNIKQDDFINLDNA